MDWGWKQLRSCVSCPEQDRYYSNTEVIRELKYRVSTNKMVTHIVNVYLMKMYTL